MLLTKRTGGNACPVFYCSAVEAALSALPESAALSAFEPVSAVPEVSAFPPAAPDSAFPESSAVPAEEETSEATEEVTELDVSSDFEPPK